ncbi:hypothetical protein TrispH2_003249 [Trichoplax sp. H2]|nr:hypothetical protein TrispH2_003249 [Trichoplax sp. H2]|eukprot:RDD44336.1 hypothetical protein TrispH2_003249 [Trichoplax sp. H2]
MKNEDNGTVDAIDSATFKVGHEMDSETSYAKPVISNHYPWVFTDCPGFLDNRDPDDAVVTAISSPLAVRNARQVKAVVILIEISGILRAGLEALSTLLKVLITLFHNPVDMVNYSVFGITKTDLLGLTEDRAKQKVWDAFKKIVKHCDQKLDTIKKEPQRSVESPRYFYIMIVTRSRIWDFELSFPLVYFYLEAQAKRDIIHTLTRHKNCDNKSALVRT